MSTQASVGSGHFARWHRGHGEALPPLHLIVAQLFNHAIHHVVMLAIHALSSGCLATLAILDSGGAISTIKLYTVEGEGVAGHDGGVN
jgi:hypothetical protein